MGGRGRKGASPNRKRRCAGAGRESVKKRKSSRQTRVPGGERNPCLHESDWTLASTRFRADDARWVVRNGLGIARRRPCPGRDSRSFTASRKSLASPSCPRRWGEEYGFCRKGSIEVSRPEIPGKTSCFAASSTSVVTEIRSILVPGRRARGAPIRPLPNRCAAVSSDVAANVDRTSIERRSSVDRALPTCGRGLCAVVRTDHNAPMRRPRERIPGPAFRSGRGSDRSPSPRTANASLLAPDSFPLRHEIVDRCE